MKLALPAWLLITGAVAADHSENWSEMRERWNATQSPYLDIRRTVLGVNPGAAIPGAGIEFSTRAYSVPRSYDVNSRITDSKNVTDHQEVVAAQLRQMCVVGPLGWEVRCGWAGSRSTGEQGDPIDPQVGANYSLYSSRYAGVSLYGGVGIPVGSAYNWIENHGGISYRGELRAACTSGQFAFAVNLGGTICRGGENNDARGYTIPTTPPTSGKVWVTDFTQMDAKFLVSYRVTRWFRAGIEQEAISYRWEGSAQYLELTSSITSAPTSALVEFSVPYGWHISVSVGKEFIANPKPPSMRAELAVTKTFY